MDIPNLSQPSSANTNSTPSRFSLPIVLIIVVLAIAAGFGFSRLAPGRSTTGSSSTAVDQPQLSTDNISSAAQLKVGQLYGDVNSTFTDSATGTVQSGGINGTGTNTLIRDGGPSQSVALTSSTVDLSLFVGKKVEVKGQTNSAAKVGWLMDVGSIKILE